MNKLEKKVILISGPTASGKSDFALKLAYKMGGEIINADIGSMYTPLTIGTAKPAWKEEQIAHHMFDVLDQPINFTVMQFRHKLKILIEEIWSRGHTPIIVGGSAFYIKACFYEQYDIANTEQIVKDLENLLSKHQTNSNVLWQELNQLDSARAEKIHIHDTYRIVRALAICKATGSKASSFKPLFKPLAPFKFFICMSDRQNLYERINQRVVKMIDQGWIDEVKNLQGTDWQKFLMIKKMIGYDDLLGYLENSNYLNLQDTINVIQQKTRNYAKRQIIFLNKLKNDIQSALIGSKYDGTLEDIDLTML